ncbi:Prefoldin beta-like protein [Basidiobolus meristosporus CBS 931.73]|uniref:Prefoldin beta-like protein n=1 Tax=Basidiobolus meristosporus CBS 931.73 TaxID=1314790 RepID=A0A1Y1Z7U0_9FUNG|nr:Prefoldin beta-like protein [Basidiobolus meristosporus CBS 931.73]|eukprot:ORY06349.1 Prefoldin beta-like protein [Basidiobolus meristosporus CBS 931.73]
MSVEARLEAESLAFQNLQKEFAKVVESRQRLDSQLQENEIVAKEFSVLKDDANIYKLIGPVLVKQEKVEANTNVQKRIEFIKAEIKRLEEQIKDLSEKQEKKKTEIVKLQTLYQEQMQKQQA